MARKSNLDIIKDYFPGRWRWLTHAQYWTGYVHTQRTVTERLVKIFTKRNPDAREREKVKWIATCGSIEVSAYNLHDVCALLRKHLYG